MRAWLVLALGFGCACQGNTPHDDAAVVDDAPPSVSGCVPPPPPSPPLPSAKTAAGTRLIPRTIVEPGGFEALWSIHDSQLGVDCEPRPFVDGTIRCIPTFSNADFEHWGDYFADAARTIPVTRQPIAGGAAAGSLGTFDYSETHFGIGSPFECGSIGIGSLSRIGSQRSDTEYYTATTGPNPVEPGLAMFSLIPEQADFVVLDEVRTQLVGAVAVRELHGSDGSQLFPRTELYDSAHDSPVYLRPGVSTLAPSRVSTLLHLHIDAPPTDMTIVDWCLATDPNLFSRYDSTLRCEFPDLRYILDDDDNIHGVELQTGPLYRCELAKGPPFVTMETASYVRVCDTQPMSEWASVETSVIGSGQLRTTQTSINGVTYGYASNAFEDTIQGFPCVAQTASDGSLRCLPSQDGLVVFNDPNCTNRVATRFQGTPTFAAEWTQAARGFPDQTVRGRATIHAVGTARSDERLYVQSTTGCFDIDIRPSWNLGAVLPPSSFAPLELRDVPL